MGEGKVDVKSPRPEVLEREAEEIRFDITEVANELNRRRHELFDWRFQLKARGPAIAVALLGTLLVAGATIGVRRWRRRRNARPLYKARQFRDAFSRVVEHPELVARRQPGVGNKALAAAVSSVAGVVAKALTERAVIPATRITSESWGSEGKSL